jgi:hypothetical protein
LPVVRRTRNLFLAFLFASNSDCQQFRLPAILLAS